MDAGKGHQVSTQAAQSLQKEVGQNIKYKNRNKRFRDGEPSWEGVVKEKFPNSRKPLTGRSVRSFGISEGNITRRKKNPQNMRLTPTPSRDVAQMLTSTTSEQGLNRKTQVACLG